MTLQESTPSKPPPRNRLILEAIDGYEYCFAKKDDAPSLAFLFEEAFNESRLPVAQGIDLFGA